MLLADLGVAALPAAPDFGERGENQVAHDALERERRKGVVEHRLERSFVVGLDRRQQARLCVLDQPARRRLVREHHSRLASAAEMPSARARCMRATRSASASV